jgi:hypothetical protein
MRAFEQDMKTYLRAKVTNVKEDILRRNQKVKRTLRLMLDVKQDESEWTLRLEGRVQDGLSETQVLE